MKKERTEEENSLAIQGLTISVAQLADAVNILNERLKKLEDSHR